jgi:hypothetical protein
VPTESPATNTMGMSEVASLAAATLVVPPATMMSTFRWTRVCLQLRDFFTRTDQNQRRNAVLSWGFQISC